MGSNAVQLDFSKAQPLSLDFSKAQPIQGASVPSSPKEQTTYLEDLQHLMEQTAVKRQVSQLTEAAHAPVPKDSSGHFQADVSPWKAAVLAYAPNTVARTINTAREFLSPTNAALAALAAHPITRAIMAPVMMMMGGESGLKAPVTLGKTAVEAVTGKDLGVSPDQAEEAGLKGGMFYGGAAGTAEAGPKAIKAGVREYGGVSNQDMLAAKSKATQEAVEKLNDAQAKHDANVAKQTDNQAARSINQSRVDAAARQATENITQTHASEKASLDNRYAQFKQTMGPNPVTGAAGAETDLAPVADAVNAARTNTLKGSQEKIGIFNSILGKVKDYIDDPSAPGGMKATPTKLPFDQVWGFVQELGNALYGSDVKRMPDVAQALREVRKSAVDSLDSTVKAQGGQTALDQWNKLKEDYTDYARTWKDTRYSPLAKVINLTNQPTTTAQGFSPHTEVGKILSGGGGERAAYLLGRKTPFGASMEPISRLRAALQDLKATPSSKDVGPFTPPQPDPFNPEVWRREQLSKTAASMRHPNYWDLLSILGGAGAGHPIAGLSYPVGRRVLGRTLQSQAVLDWLSKNP